MYFILNKINPSKIFNKFDEFHNYTNIIKPEIRSEALMFVKRKIMSKIMASYHFQMIFFFNVLKNERNSIKERT